MVHRLTTVAAVLATDDAGGAGLWHPKPLGADLPGVVAPALRGIAEFRHGHQLYGGEAGVCHMV